MMPAVNGGFWGLPAITGWTTRRLAAWASRGKLTAARTPFGHRRYREAEIRALKAGTS